MTDHLARAEEHRDLVAGLEYEERYAPEYDAEPPGCGDCDCDEESLGEEWFGESRQGQDRQGQARRDEPWRGAARKA